MSFDMNAFLNNVKRAAVEAVKAGSPFAFVLGTVTGTSPLTVRVDQKLELFAEQLILTNAVRDYTVEMTVDHHTEPADHGGENHTHPYQGKKSFRVHLALKKGEQVIMLQTDGGQKYIILDRVEALP